MTKYKSHIHKGQRDDFNDATDTAKKHTKPLRDSFFVALGETKDRYELTAMQEALEARNIHAAIKASHVDDLELLLQGIGIDQGELVFSDEVINTFNDGAGLAATLLPALKQKEIVYNPLADRTVRFLRSNGAILVREITDSTRRGVNRAIVRGFETGVSPRKQAREIRSLVGLTTSQTNAVINFRLQLEQRLNSPKDQFGNTRTMSPAASRRLSAVEQAQVRSHMKNNTFDQAKIDQMVNRYTESLQNKRANDIARTEALNAVNNGQLELWKQGLEQGVLDPKTTKKKWVVTRDDKLRKDHAAIPIMNPKGVAINSFFTTPFGPVMSPGDPLTDLINCRCGLVLTGI